MMIKHVDTINTIPKIETTSYILRGLTIKDAQGLFPCLSDRETMKYITPHPVKSIEEVCDTINNSLEKFDQRKEIPWVVVNKKDNDVIGLFRFHTLNSWHKKTEMGVVIRKDYQNRGVMTEIFRKVIPFGFNTLGLNRIVGDIFAENKGSEKLLIKFGFHKDGVMRQTDFDGERYHDTVVYSMLKEEFDEKQSLFDKLE